LAAAVLELLDSRERRDRFARRAREIGESDFSLEGIARKTLEVYRELLES
jgi:glycosyltransferase involved in cell wall biosynthesis